MKRIAAALFAALLFLCGLPVALAEEEALDAELPALGGYLLTEATTGQRIAGKNEGERYFVAGLSKLPAILTLAQAFDDGTVSEDAVMRVSARAADVPGPTAFLEEGEQIKAGALMKAAVMISAGDAIITLCENVFGSEGVMLENMAVTMRMLGLECEQTSVLGAETPFSAETLASLGSAAAKSPTFSKYSALFLDSIQHDDGRETELVNANRMVRFYAGASGVLTGSSQQDGYCGVISVNRSGTTLIAVVIGAKDSGTRFAAAEAMLNYGFQNFTAKQLAKAGGVLVPGVPVRGGSKKTVNLIAHEDVTVLVKKNLGKLLETRDVPDTLEAPITAEEVVGTVTYADEAGTVVAEFNLYADTAVEPFGILDILRRMMRDFAA